MDKGKETIETSVNFCRMRSSFLAKVAVIEFQQQRRIPAWIQLGSNVIYHPVQKVSDFIFPRGK
jgi:hypothetical protein